MSQAYHGHGTAVLGEVVAVDNTRGGVGIAPAASARVVSQCRTSTDLQHRRRRSSPRPTRCRRATCCCSRRRPPSAASTYLPVEVEDAVFDAIRDAVDAGIVVVEAAGNGSNDLDNFTNAANERILLRGRLRLPRLGRDHGRRGERRARRTRGSASRTSAAASTATRGARASTPPATGGWARRPRPTPARSAAPRARARSSPARRCCCRAGSVAREGQPLDPSCGALLAERRRSTRRATTPTSTASA